MTKSVAGIAKSESSRFFMCCPRSYMCTDTVEGKTSGMRASSMLCVAWSRQPLMCWRPPTAAARWRRSSIHRRARSNAPEMNFLCARAAVQRVAAADALCERHPTMTMECMYFAPHTRPARPHAHTHFRRRPPQSERAHGAERARCVERNTYTPMSS